MNIKFYLNIVILFYIWQWLAYCFDYSTELNIAKFLQIKHKWKNIIFLWSIRENLAKSPQSIQIESDSSGT